MGKSETNSRDPWEPAASTRARPAGGVDSRESKRGGGRAGFQLSFAYMVREVFAMERDLLGTVPRPWASLIVKREMRVPGTTKAEMP